MDFKNAYEHYRDGTASEEERRLVEEEIEKYQLISDHLDDQWEDTTLAQPPQEDMKKVRKSLRKRSTATVLTCFLLAAAMILGAMGVEKLFWDPEKDSYDLEYFTDLELMLMAYSELFSPAQMVSNVTAERTGFGSYLLTVQVWENFTLMDINYRTATLKRGHLNIPSGFWEILSVNDFARASYPVYPMDEEFIQETYDTLSQLPEYIQVRGAVSFPEDLTMEELLEFQATLEDGYIWWVGIRNSPVDEQRYPLCGMKPFTGGYVIYEMNPYYPCFDIKGIDPTAEDLETHFKSLLQFSLDHTDPDEDDYYERVLSYVEENGVMTYGCYVVGSPELFLELLDSGAASQVWVQDAWIDIA